MSAKKEELGKSGQIEVDVCDTLPASEVEQPTEKVQNPVENKPQPEKLHKPEKSKSKRKGKTEEAGAEDTGKEKPASKRKTVAVITVPVEKQTAYERRTYMRGDGEADEIVRHKTSHTRKELENLLVPEMQRQYLLRMQAESPKDPEVFFTADLVEGLNICGPAYGDNVRGAMQALSKVKPNPQVRVRKTVKKGRNTYKYILLDLPKVPTKETAGQVEVPVENVASVPAS